MQIISSSTVRKIPLALPVFDEEMEAAALNALHNERYVLGEDVYKFEEEFAAYMGTQFAVSTSSGTNALHIALLALGLSHTDEVITSPFSFVASANAVLHAGATPVFADIESKGFNISPDKVKQRINKHTKALLPIHLFGHPCNMREITVIAEENGLKVVEDACQAHGAEYYGQKAGAIGDVGCFSFYPSKNMTVCGDGGMIVTNNEDTAKLAAKLRDCGRKSQYEHDVVGYTSRLNTVGAAIGRVQLKRLDEWNKKRAENASVYEQFLSGITDIGVPPKGDSNVKPVYHLYVVRARKRNELREWLLNSGVQCGVHYPIPIPLQPIYKQMFEYKGGEFPLSERASAECLSLPVYPTLAREDIQQVCERIQELYLKY